MTTTTRSKREQMEKLTAEADAVDTSHPDVVGFLHRWADRYSQRNLMLLYVQRPDATELHTYRGWLHEHRQVRKGEKAIRLFAPHTESDSLDDDHTESDSLDDDQTLVRVRPIALFDISQTDPVDDARSISDRRESATPGGGSSS